MTDRGAGCWEIRLSGSVRGWVTTQIMGEILWHRRRSGQQGRESCGVKVPTPSVTRFRTASISTARGGNKPRYAWK
jgi:hypothetical protein